MTVEVVLVAAFRIVGSLPVLRWPLAGGLLAILVDLSDLVLIDLLDLGGVGGIEGYQMNELAALLELPEGTVKSRLHLARKRLAEALR